MTAVRRDLYLEQGATFEWSFTWYKASETPGTLGEPYDLTGATARMQIRKSLRGEVLIDASTENGRIVLGGPTGRVDLVFSAADTNNLTARSGVYDLEVEMADGKVYRLLQGTVLISPNVTQEQVI